MFGTVSANSISISSEYPANLSIDYPERLSRLTTLLRFITLIPISVVLALLVGASDELETLEFGTAGLVIGPPLVMILFRKKYPRW